MDGVASEILSLQDYVASLDDCTLPRILQICSGVYFQGSVYELGGSEVCLSTGDLVKVIGVQLQSVTCEDLGTNETSELSLDYTGRFRIVPEDELFGCVEDMVELVLSEPGARDTFSFTCQQDLELEDGWVPAGQPLSLLSVDRQGEGEGEGEGVARCWLDGAAGREVLVPLSFRGAFYESESGHAYAVREIVSSPHLRRRRYRHAQEPGPDGPLRLTPVHSVQAIMHLRKNVVQFPSSLEVDVVDVSERCADVVFVTPLTLPEVAARSADAFPAVVEVLEAPESARPLFRCRWLPPLRPGRLLVLRGAGESRMVLASSFKGSRERRHFLLSDRYGGSFRRRPRNFGSAYELYAASCRGPAGLTVTVAMQWESPADDLPSLSVGDQLEVLRRGGAEPGCRGDDGDDDGAGAWPRGEDVLVCRRTSEADEDEDEEGEEGRGEESEEVRLPMYLQGQFVEKLADTKKRYGLPELVERLALPLDVKAVRRDPRLETDPLPALSSLQLEEATSEPTVMASLLEQPDVVFELPIRWLSMTVSFTGDPLPWTEGPPHPEPRLETVTEVTDEFYFEFRKLVSQDGEAPPPRPPKRKTQSAQKAPPTATSCSNQSSRLCKGQSLSQSMDKMTLSSDWPGKAPPLPSPLDAWDEAPPLIPRKPNAKANAQSNMYTKTPKREKKKKGRRNSDHDYEDILDVVKNAQDILFY